MTFSVFEDYVNSSRAHLETALVDLRAGKRIDQLGGLDSANLNVPGVPSMATLADRIYHLNRHWFGMKQTKDGKWVKPISFDRPLTDDSGATLYWQNYAGDVEAIMRQTMIRACEVALGLEHGEPITASRRHPAWPIELLWKCGQNWFEGWMTWTTDRVDAAGKHGHVTVMICTPTSGAPVRQSAIAPPGNTAAHKPDYSENPSNTSDKGMVVVTNERHVPVLEFSADYPPVMNAGVLAPPLQMYWRATGRIVAVSPSEPDGGVLSSGRQWA